MVSVSVTTIHLFTHTPHAGYILNAHIPMVSISKPNMPFVMILLYHSLSLIVSASAILLFQIIEWCVCELLASLSRLLSKWCVRIIEEKRILIPFISFMCIGGEYWRSGVGME